jgi:hypothetical protein
VEYGIPEVAQAGKFHLFCMSEKISVSYFGTTSSPNIILLFAVASSLMKLEFIGN